MEIDRTLYPPDAESELEEKYHLPDRCLHIYDVEGAESRVDGDDEVVLREAVREFMATGVDTLLTFTSIPSGADYVIKASRVGDWLVTTADSRLISRTIRVAYERVAKASSLFDSGDS